MKTKKTIRMTMSMHQFEMKKKKKKYPILFYSEDASDDDDDQVSPPPRGNRIGTVRYEVFVLCKRVLFSSFV